MANLLGCENELHNDLGPRDAREFLRIASQICDVVYAPQSPRRIDDKRSIAR